MPDILIWGMEMPRNVRTVSIFSDGTMLDYLTGMYVGKAVALPPHGDLIDRDALVRNLLPMQTNPRFQRIKRGFAKAIAVAKDLPAIVPANKEESE